MVVLDSDDDRHGREKPAEDARSGGEEYTLEPHHPRTPTPSENMVDATPSLAPEAIETGLSDAQQAKLQTLVAEVLEEFKASPSVERGHQLAEERVTGDVEVDTPLLSFISDMIERWQDAQ